ncbi:MAG: tyrosine--tRNA ligase [Acutalibacteraceae bacterium]
MQPPHRKPAAHYGTGAFQRAGHTPIALVGGGTGLIGDPSGKAQERTMLSREEVEHNCEGIRAQLERFLDFKGSHAAIMVNNADWLCEVKLLDFMRDIGKFFSVNALLNRDSVRARLEDRESGISFTEFSYILLQAYDYLYLNKNTTAGCRSAVPISGAISYRAWISHAA